MKAATDREAGPVWPAGFDSLFLLESLIAASGSRFDAFASVLASLLDVAHDDPRARFGRHVEDELVREDPPMLPALHPVIEPANEDWEDLRVMFSCTFNKKPCEFHNGGLWPLLKCFYAADLPRVGSADAAVIARKALDGRTAFGAHHVSQ